MDVDDLIFDELTGVSVPAVSPVSSSGSGIQCFAASFWSSVAAFSSFIDILKRA